MFNHKEIKNRLFHCIGIVGIPRKSELFKIHKKIYHWLNMKKYNVIVEKKILRKINLKNPIVEKLSKISELADLIIIVGGDGNMLSAAKVISCYQNKVIGVNCGKLGFLTDLKSKNLIKELEKILNGNFYEEKRFLLEVKILKKNNKFYSSTAINDVVLYKNNITQMIDFEVYIDDFFAFSQRSDGLIINTPTGSTAYSLSAGGPILTPNLNAISLIPMFSHDFFSRPLVVSGNSSIKLKFNQKNINCRISCDTQIVFSIQYGDEVIIKKSNKNLNLVHPNWYNYFKILNVKLGWSKKNM